MKPRKGFTERTYLTHEEATALLAPLDEPIDQTQTPEPEVRPEPVPQDAPEQPEQTTGDEQRQERPAPARRQKVRKNDKDNYRQINPDLLEAIYSGTFTGTELKVILYVVWSITSSQTRNYVDVRHSTIQERTKMSKGQVSKTLKRLIERGILQRDSHSKTRYIFNPNPTTWL